MDSIINEIKEIASKEVLSEDDKKRLKELSGSLKEEADKLKEVLDAQLPFPIVEKDLLVQLASELLILLKMKTDLMAIIDSGSVVEKYENFGTNIPMGTDLLELEKKSRIMVSRCKRWITNWETVQETIKPKVVEITKDLMAAKVANLNPEELTLLLEAVQTRLL